MKMLIITASLLLAGACAEAPACDRGTSRPWCGEGESPTFVDEGGETNVLLAVCDDRWVYRCEIRADGSRSANTGDYEGESLASPACDDTETTCETGSPMCISVPCDGETYFGNGHSRELP